MDAFIIYGITIHSTCCHSGRVQVGHTGCSQKREALKSRGVFNNKGVNPCQTINGQKPSRSHRWPLAVGGNVFKRMKAVEQLPSLLV